MQEQNKNKDIYRYIDIPWLLLCWSRVPAGAAARPAIGRGWRRAILTRQRWSHRRPRCSKRVLVVMALMVVTDGVAPGPVLACLLPSYGVFRFPPRLLICSSCVFAATAAVGDDADCVQP